MCAMSPVRKGIELETEMMDVNKPVLQDTIAMVGSRDLEHVEFSGNLSTPVDLGQTRRAREFPK